MFLKIAVLNNSGNVGKSTICQSMLQPRLPESEIVKVESNNSDGTNDVKFSAKEFDTILKKIDASDCAIVDVGSSNIENFILKMQEYKDSHEDIDYFIIPVTPPHKQQVDSVATASMLLTMGIETDRIKFIFNQVDKTQTIKKQYADFLSGMKDLDITIDKHSIVYDTSVFSMLNKMGQTFAGVAADDTDYRKMLRETECKKKREKISEKRSIKRLVNGVNEDLDIAFEMLEIA